LARVFQHELDHLDGILISDDCRAIPHPDDPLPAPRRQGSTITLLAAALATPTPFMARRSRTSHWL
jgi:hypothetical protein